MTQWYVQREGKIIGPMPASDVTNAARAGKLLPTDLVRNANTQEWVEARAMRALAEIFADQNTRLESAPAARVASVDSGLSSSTRLSGGRGQGAENPFASPRSEVGPPIRSLENANARLAQPRYAKILARYLAVVLDQLLIVFLILTAAVLYYWGSGEDPLVMLGVLRLNLVANLLAISWKTWFLRSSWSATPGKFCLGLRVTDLTGNRLGWGTALGRCMAEYLSAATLIGYLLPLFTPKRQTLHDLLAGTIVRDD